MRGPLAGFGLARKVRSSFELAVQLDPANLAALSDLGEYYVAAPSIVGGGDDKARALAARMMPQSPAAAHRLLARLAESNKDLPPRSLSSNWRSLRKGLPKRGSTSPTSTRPTTVSTTRSPRSSPGWQPTTPTVPSWSTQPAFSPRRTVPPISPSAACACTSHLQPGPMPLRPSKSISSSAACSQLAERLPKPAGRLPAPPPWPQPSPAKAPERRRAPDAARPHHKR